MQLQLYRIDYQTQQEAFYNSSHAHQHYELFTLPEMPPTIFILPLIQCGIMTAFWFLATKCITLLPRLIPITRSVVVGFSEIVSSLLLGLI